jgi:hypothetical protein
MEYTTLAIVSAAIAAFVQFIKSSSQLNATGVRLLVVGLSLLAGTVYYFFNDTTVWVASLEILALANTVYLFLIKPFFEE